MTAKKMLETARANLASENNVVLDPANYYETTNGDFVDFFDGLKELTVCRFCLFGALYILCKDPSYGMSIEHENAADLLRRAADEDGFDVNTDATPANHSRMLAIYDSAISLAAKTEGEKSNDG